MPNREFYHHRGEPKKLNRLAYRDLVNNTFEDIFNKNLKEIEEATGKPVSPERQDELRRIAWEDYKKTIKEY